MSLSTINNLVTNAHRKISLQLEEITPADKLLSIGMFPNDVILEQSLHCMTCNCHLGTSLEAAQSIETHPVLSTTQCSNCLDLYNDGEFIKDTDGVDFYCRWCGQGGNVVMCSTCRFVFCRKCIINFSPNYMKYLDGQYEEDEWICFSCDPEILKDNRAQHCALLSYMYKKLESMQIVSERKLRRLADDDESICCPKKSGPSRLKQVLNDKNSSDVDLLDTKANEGGEGSSITLDNFPVVSSASSESDAKHEVPNQKYKSDCSDKVFGKSKAEFIADLNGQLEVYLSMLNKTLQSEPVTASDLKNLYHRLNRINSDASNKMRELHELLTAGKQNSKQQESNASSSTSNTIQ